MSKQNERTEKCMAIEREAPNLPANDQALFTIGTAASMLALSPRTLRIYERDGLVSPSRRGKWRYYSRDNIKWINCLRSMIREHRISVPAVRKLLQYTTCWNIAGCSFEKRRQCTAFMSSALVPKKIRIPSMGEQHLSA